MSCQFTLRDYHSSKNLFEQYVGMTVIKPRVVLIFHLPFMERKKNSEPTSFMKTLRCIFFFTVKVFKTFFCYSRHAHSSWCWKTFRNKKVSTSLTPYPFFFAMTLPSFLYKDENWVFLNKFLIIFWKEFQYINFSYFQVFRTKKLLFFELCFYSSATECS